MAIQTKDAGSLAISILEMKMEPIQATLEQDEAFSFLDSSSNIRHASAIAVTFSGRIILVYTALRPYHPEDGTVLFAEEVTDSSGSAIVTRGGEASMYLDRALSAMEEIPTMLNTETIDHIIAAYNNEVGMDPYDIKQRIAAYQWFGTARALDGYIKETDPKPES